MTWIQMSECEFPKEIRVALPTPLSHAALSVVAPVLLSGGAFYVMIFFQFFGQTEAPMVITHLKKAEQDLSVPERLASCGKPVPWMHVALLDDEDRPVGPGESGEICVRGPLVMDGYKGLADETAEASRAAGCTPATSGVSTMRGSFTSLTEPRTW